MGAIFMTVLSAGISAASSIAQGNAQASAARAQADQSRYQAQVAEQNAALARAASEESLAEGAREEKKFRRRAKQFSAQQFAQLAASGAQLSGSPLNVLADTAMGTEEDAQQIKYNALKNMWGNLVEEGNYLNQANAAYNAASAYESQAKSAKRAGMIGAVGGLLGAGVSLYSSSHSTYSNGVIKPAANNGFGGADTYSKVASGGGYYQSANRYQGSTGSPYGMGNPAKSFVW